MESEQQKDTLREIAEIRVGDVKPSWYHADIAIQALAQRVLALEEEVTQLKSPKES